MTVEEMRVLTGDLPRYEEVTFEGDGVRTTFQTPNAPLVEGSVSVTVDGAPVVLDVAYAVRYGHGLLIFEQAPDDGAAIVAEVEHVLVSDRDYEIVRSLDTDIRYAAALMLDRIASDQALLIKVALLPDWTQLDGTKLATELRERAEALRKRSYRELAF
jgi:hypothetical protein